MRLAGSVAAASPAPVARWVAETAAVPLARLAARPGSAWAERRIMVERHLRRATGDPGGRAGPRLTDAMVDGAFASYARYWAESLRLPRLHPGTVAAGIEYEGFGHIAAGWAAGRGTILALPHLGGWEWAGTHLATAGYGLSVVVERLDPPDLFDWFVGFRRKLGMQVIAAGPDAAARCSAALDANHLLCLLSDRLIAGTAGIEVEFFGERTELPAGPAMLAVRSGATLLPAAVYFGARTETHHGLVLPPVDTARRGGRLRDDVQRVTQDLARAFEHLIRRAPTQWHLMQPNWPSDRPGTDPPGLGPSSL